MTSSITDFSLRSTDISCKSVAQTIRCFKSLERLFVRWKLSYGAKYFGRIQFPDLIFRSLDSQQDSLKSLTLNSVSIPLGPIFVAQMPSLAGFKKLEYLAVDQDYVLWQTPTDDSRDEGDQKQENEAAPWPPRLKYLTHFCRDGYSFHLETLGRIISTQPPCTLETFTSMTHRTDPISSKDIDSLKPYTSSIFEADISLDEMEECQIRIATTKVASLVKKMFDNDAVNESPLEFPQFLDDEKIGGLSKSSRLLFQKPDLVAEIQGLFSGFLEPYHNLEEEHE